MARYTPQFDLYKIIGRFSMLCDTMFWIVFGLSITPSALQAFPMKIDATPLIGVLNIICITLFFILEIVVDHFLIPLAETRRMDDFIDNSFKSQFSPQNSDGYYDNNEVKYGVYKAAVNLFENSFFTYNLLKRNTIGKIAIPGVTLIVVFITAYFGFKELPFALSILQVLFSANLMGSLIKHLILLNKLSVIFDDWMKLFQLKDFNGSTSKFNNYVYRNWLRYETLLSKAPAKIPDRLFKKYNPILTQQWTELKQKFDIK